MSDPISSDQLPTISLDLRIPSEGDTILKIDGRAIHGVQSLKVEMDSEKMVPMVSITFAAKYVQMELPKSSVKQTLPVITLPVFSKEK